MPDQKVSSIFSWWNTSLDPIRGKNNTSGTVAKETIHDLCTFEFGKGFDARRLRDYRQFYLYFPDGEIWHACVPNLTWTHFRSLLRVPDAEARAWYLNEASRESWSSSTLDRNIGS